MTTNPEPLNQLENDATHERASRRAKHEEYKSRRRELATAEEQESAKRDFEYQMAKREKKAQRRAVSRERARTKKSLGSRMRRRVGRLFNS